MPILITNKCLKCSIFNIQLQPFKKLTPSLFAQILYDLF